MFKYIGLTLSLLVLAHADLSCTVCHSNNIDFSHLKSKKEWRILTVDGGEALKKMHKNNLDVIKFIESDDYNEDEVYDKIHFFAYSTPEQTAFLNLKKCKTCHDWRVGMLRTKSQWQGLTSSLDLLTQTHATDKETVTWIESNSFKNEKILAHFIKKISFHASNRVSAPIRNTLNKNAKRKTIHYDKVELKDVKFEFNFKK